MQRHFARKAAKTARVQIAESTRRAADRESESELDEPAPKAARTSGPDTHQIYRNSDRAPTLYISIDWGMKFTTVAYHRHGSSIENIHTIDDFPGEKYHHQTRRQIPTEIWYPNENARPFGHIKDHDIRIRFGNEVHRMAEDDEGIEVRKIYVDADRVINMKLLLDESDYAQASKRLLQETLETIKRKGHIKDNEDVFFHFFREVFKALKPRLGPDFVDDSTGMSLDHPRLPC